MTITNIAAPAAQAQFITGSVTSQDGTTIGYRQIGQGPALVLVHGAMESVQSHTQLAEALADAFTVYAYDRRGRGASGPHGPNFSIQEEVDDLEALLTRSGAHLLFGVSAGALIALQAALTLPAIHKLAAYEPALFLDKANPAAILARYDREMAQGKDTAALVTGMLGAQMGPPIFSHLPRWLLERLTLMGMQSEDKKARPEDVTMRKLAATLHYDFQIVADISGEQERFKDIRAEVLLLGGSASPAYLKTALAAMQKVLPQAQRIEFPGLNHGGSGNTDRFGQPQIVAQALRAFFA